MIWERSSNDSRIVRRVLAGKSEDFALLVNRYLHAAHALAFAVLGNQADAEDAVQEAFLQAYHALNKLRDGEGFGFWLRSIVRNQCFNLRARNARELNGRSMFGEFAQPTEQKAMEVDESRVLVREAIMRLDETSREILMLYYYAEKDTVEIAEMLGVSRAAARKRLQRAREQLGERLLENITPGSKDTQRAAAREAAVMGAVLASPPAWLLVHPALTTFGMLAQTAGGIGTMSALGLLAVLTSAGVYLAAHSDSAPAPIPAQPLTARSVVTPVERVDAPAPRNAADAAVKTARLEQIVATTQAAAEPVRNPGSMAGGNPQRTGYYDVAGPRTRPNVLWSRPFGVKWADAGYRVVLDEKQNLYITHSTGNGTVPDVAYEKGADTLLAFTSNGQPLWTSPPSGNWKTFSIPAITGDAVVFGSRDGFLRAYDRATGAEKWSAFVTTDIQGVRDGVLSSPVVDRNGDIYVGGRFFTAFFKFSANGAALWETQLPAGANREKGTASSPALSKDESTVYFGRGTGPKVEDKIGDGLYALNASTGAIKWHFNVEGPHPLRLGWCSPMIGPDGTVYQQEESTGVLYAVSDKGSAAEAKWTFSPQTEGDAPHFPAMDADTVYLATAGEMPVLCAVNLDGSLKWFHTFDGAQGMMGSPVVTREAVYITADNVGLCCLDRDTGAQLWAWNPWGMALDISLLGEAIAFGPDGTIYWAISAPYPDGDKPRVIDNKDGDDIPTTPMIMALK